MDIEFYKILKVDNVANEVSIETFANQDNIKEYILELITNCVHSEGDREYLFEQTLTTMQTHINDIVLNRNRDQACVNIAKKLLAVEKDSKEKIMHLGKNIPNGILMISYTKMTNEGEYKIIITKADYTEFLEELSGERKSGLPTKKKIFKAFIMNVTINATGYDIGRILTYDSNSTTKAVYWWKTFLELVEIRDDDKNTITAYQCIKKYIINPIKEKHKHDYFYLRNHTIAYFRSEGTFDINHYKNIIIGSYIPFDNTLDIVNLKDLVGKLPQKYKFDPIFEKRPGVIRDKFIDSIPLTDEMELKIKQDIPNISQVIQKYEDGEGRKYIMILSPQGYAYAEGLNRNQNE